MNNEPVITLSSKAAAWFGHIKEWEKSNTSQREFCQTRNINLGTFSYWRTQYLKQQGVTKVAPTKKSIGLIPITLTPSPPTTDVIQVRHPSGFSLAFPLTMSISDVVTLLQKVGGSYAS